jgi:PAS domain S-box-containing protein
MRVLVVEDDELYRQIMESVLARRDHEAVLAPSGAEALDVARKVRPDVVITDVFMPGMDGFRLCMKWQRDPELAHIPLVFYSSVYTSPADEAFALRLGARAFLAKPMDPELLLDALEAAVASPEIEPSAPLEDEFTALSDYTDRVVERLEEKVDELRVTNQMLTLATEMQSALFSCTSLGIALMDDDCGIRLWSPAAEAIFGYTAGDVVGRFNPLVQADGLAGDALCAQLRAGETIQDLELKLHRKDGSEFYISLSATALLDDTGSPHGVLAMFSDITQRMESDAELQVAMQDLERAMDGSVEVISRMVEQRDPYTAGHEQRVAQLAAAIGEKMGLAVEQVHHLKTAAAVHDVGKISVPAEILAKSGTLSRLASEIVKMHPLVGAEILECVDFGYPLAEIVAQHHERMDGSGYPLGLSGDDILLEARIIGVADVVEAMSSHRPYRPAHEIAEALEEIKQNRGRLYDPDVVDACVAVVEARAVDLQPSA